MNIPAGIDTPAGRDFHRPRLRDCRRRTCLQRRGDQCKTPAGAHAPYHRERCADTAGLTDAELVAEFAQLDIELAERRAERDAEMHRPLSAEVLQTRAAVSAAWAKVGRDVAQAERAAREHCSDPYLHAGGCRCRTNPPVPRPAGQVVELAAWRGRREDRA
jgi:hypothetical protein